MAESFTDRVARIRREQEAEAAAPAWPADLIPEADDSAPKLREPDGIDALLSRIGILEAYERWCGKMQPDPKGKHESIMISCPRPDHADTHPSAYANTDKDVYHCGACNDGGDIYTLAGFHFNLDPKTDFVQLREAMAQDLGYSVQKVGGESFVVDATSDDVVVTDAAGEPAVIDLAEYLPDIGVPVPTLNWDKLFPNDTFMRRWMEITSKDDLPEEYYLWLGLAALGMAAGDNVVLNDNPQVKTNLFLCLYGRSGIGKTRATRALAELLERALPYDDQDFTNTGAQLVPVPGSAEALIDSFCKVEIDPVTQTQTAHPVRGVVRFDELSTLMGKSQRAGSVLKPTLMEMFDSYGPIRAKSRGAGLAIAHKHFCSAITTTQPGAIRGLLLRNDTESGFVNRWIFVAGPEKEAVAYRRAPLDITDCVSLLQGTKIWASAGRRFTLEDDALVAYETFFKTELDPHRKADQSDLLTRGDLHLKKLITLITLDEHADNPTLDIVERALAFWPYLIKTYMLVGAQIGGGPFQDCYDDMTDTLKVLEDKLGHPPKQRDISRKIGRKHGADLISKVLKVMEELGAVQKLATAGPSGRGSPIVTYHYVP